MKLNAPPFTDTHCTLSERFKTGENRALKESLHLAYSSDGTAPEIGVSICTSALCYAFNFLYVTGWFPDRTDSCLFISQPGFRSSAMTWTPLIVLGSPYLSAFCVYGCESWSIAIGYREWSGWSVKLTTHLHLMPRLRMCWAIPPLPSMSSRCGA